MRWLLAVGMMALLTPLSGCLGPQPFDPVLSAAWEPGNGFSFEVSAQGEFTERVTVDGRLVEHVHKLETGDTVAQVHFRVAKTDFKHGAIPLYLVLTSGDLYHATAASTGGAMLTLRPREQVGILGIQQHDLQPLETTIKHRRDCHACPPHSVEAKFASDGDDYPWIRFPLMDGDSWSGTIPYQGPFGSANEVASKVMGLMVVDGPGGKLETVHIRHVITQPGVAAMKELVMEEAKQAGVEIRAFEVEASHVVDTYFAPSLRNVVQDTRTTELRIHIDAQEKGERIVIDVAGSGTLSTRLVGVDLATGEEMSLEEAVATALDLPIETPPPLSGPPVSTRSLALAVDQPRVNAAQRPTVRFTTTSSGEAQSLAHVLQDGAGQTVQSGSGGDFEFEVAEPGTYLATVTGKAGEGGLVAQTRLIADYEAVLPAVCPSATVHLLLPCGDAQVPIRPGALRIELQAVRTPVTLEPGTGTLEFVAPDGTSTTAAMANNKASIVADADGKARGEGTLRFRPVMGVMEDVEYRIRVLHAPSPASSSTQLARDLVASFAASVPVVGPAGQIPTLAMP